MTHSPPALQTPLLCCVRSVMKLPHNIKNNQKNISSSCLILGSGVVSSDSHRLKRPLIFRSEDFRFDGMKTRPRLTLTFLCCWPGGIYDARLVHAQPMEISYCIKLMFFHKHRFGEKTNKTFIAVFAAFLNLYSILRNKTMALWTTSASRNDSEQRQ